MTEHEISFLIRKAIFEVYNTLGAGLFESVYEKAMVLELENLGLKVKNQVQIPAIYKGTDLGLGFILDILVEDKIIIEVKSVVELAPIHHKQILNYLKLTDLHLGILVNFNTDCILDNIVRKLNGYK
ncbi:GxxExxY protein [Frigoriflavimonas asaccharolytica]|uniref:GxxExxY protein n=1 Tax=Frigoriflavimonas asaccharolytica TaxID=2735899 RepID=A0A8J8KBE9_9FLAO|nr:GxxExxY protein [Frigoriflavimonas asaccharolytica]NRS92509.1 GxxExxY protein [Frigoriflavimonas asaccharolytica]